METSEKKESNNRFKLERLLGIILLIPPLIGVLLFTINIFIKNAGDIPKLNNLSTYWTGGYSFNTGGAGFTSSAPIYLGLMAIAGALLLKGTDKKS